MHSHDDHEADIVPPSPDATSTSAGSPIKLEPGKSAVGIVGLGYVGLPVALAFAEAGFRTIGVDRDSDRVAALAGGRSYISDITDDDVAKARRTNRFSASRSFDTLSDVSAVLIAVPTPLTDGIPDLGAITAAGTSLAEVLSPGTLVVLESTTYPGTTDEILKPLLELSGLKAGIDFLLAFSPERIDPGNRQYSFKDIPKIVGGIDEPSTLAAEALYSHVVPKVVTVSGTREAEMAKLIENTYRHVNIALVNELAMYAHEWGIDIWEAIEAAASKPFGFTPFWPGPGWGGHCIPLDPSYLSWKVRRDRAHEMRFIELAQTVNAEMPGRVVDRISLLLNERGQALRGSKIVGVGIAYKGGTDDVRGSAGAKILSKLRHLGADVMYHDPLVPVLDLGGDTYTSVGIDDPAIGEADLVVVFVSQVGVDWPVLERNARLVLDCCNATGRRSRNVTRL